MIPTTCLPAVQTYWVKIYLLLTRNIEQLRKQILHVLLWRAQEELIVNVNTDPGWEELEENELFCTEENLDGGIKFCKNLIIFYSLSPDQQKLHRIIIEAV